MANQPKNASTKPAPETKSARRPNEQGSIVVQAHMKIFDPQSKRVFVEGRA